MSSQKKNYNNQKASIDFFVSSPGLSQSEIFWNQACDNKAYNKGERIYCKASSETEHKYLPD